MSGLTDEGQVISDGYHTMPELYAHRHGLFFFMMRSHPQLAWRTQEHHPTDKPMFEGQFLAGISHPLHGEMSYHVPIQYWDLLAGIPVLEHAPPWDGYTSWDVLNRIVAWGQEL